MTSLPPPATPGLKRTIGFWGAIAVMIGVIIGSGIFRTPPFIATQFSSPLLILGLWVAGGLLCLAGALTYAELGAMHPDSGGVYVFIREGYGSCIAFVFGWAYLMLVKPFGAGGIAFVFAENLTPLLGVPAYMEKSLITKTITTEMLLVLTLVNLLGVRPSTVFAGVLTSLKFGALAAIILLAVFLGRVELGALRPALNAAPHPPGWDPLTAFAAVMAAILWTYDGWSDVGSIAGEVRQPQRTLPRIYIVGTLAVIAVYVAVNAVYFMLVPLPEMRAAALKDPGFSVAPLVMSRLLGNAGGLAVVLVILCSTLGSTHASILTGARVSYAQARDGLMFRFIGHVQPLRATPDIALLLQLLLSIAVVWLLGSFQSLADSFVFTMWIFHALAGLAIFILRAKTPERPRPFRCPGYPIVPALFVLAALGMTGLSIYADRPKTSISLLPWLGERPFLHTLPWLIVLAAGVPIYYIWRRFWPESAHPTNVDH